MDAGYALQTGDAGAERLALLEQAYGPDCARRLDALALPPGARVADLGCGTGSTALWFAARVGAEGEVCALDVSPEQLEVARRRADRAGPGADRLRFVQGSAEAPPLPAGGFDLVHCRFLLCHLPEPMAALRAMRTLARPGGWVIVFEPDVATLRSLPSTPAYERLRALTLASGRVRGHDYEIGARLAAMFERAGLREPELALIQPIHLRGQVKRLWELTSREAASSLSALGLTSPAALQALHDELEAVAAADLCAVAQPALTACWARNPG